MAYATTNPPRVMALGGIAGPSLWYYSSTDDDTAVVVAGYVTDGDALGMKVGDPVFSYESDSRVMTVLYVDAVTAGGSVDLKVATVTT